MLLGALIIVVIISISVMIFLSSSEDQTNEEFKREIVKEILQDIETIELIKK